MVCGYNGFRFLRDFCLLQLAGMVSIIFIYKVRLLLFLWKILRLPAFHIKQFGWLSKK